VGYEWLHACIRANRVVNVEPEHELRATGYKKHEAPFKEK
jgi:hypothetical protein